MFYNSKFYVLMEALLIVREIQVLVVEIVI